jgi:hypothetical protein
LWLVLTATAAGLAIQFSVLSAALGFLSGWVAAVVAFASTAGAPSPACAKLGDLAKQAALLNYGHLIGWGARHRPDDIWETLLEALPSDALPKSEISRETCFFRHQLK